MRAKTSPAINPILSREIRLRWRDGRAFNLVFIFAAGLALLFAWVYKDSATPSSQIVPSGRWALIGHGLFAQLAWVQCLAWLLISPALTSSAIAYERERGWFDSLLLSPLTPGQIALGKWTSALLYASMLYAVTLPFSALTLLLGGVSPGEFWLVVVLHVLCACWGASIGLAASAWSPRATVALRTSYGIIIMWLIGSTVGASAASELPIRGGSIGFFSSPLPLLAWWGRTNPILRSVEIVSPDYAQHWPFCFTFLGLSTLFFVWVAAHYSQKPLEDAPFIERKKRRPKKGDAPLPTHGEIPVVSRLKFRNPVLDREVRGKFRMRQPPLAVIIVEAILGVLVAAFYIRTLLWALFDPFDRPNIWWGLVFTALIVTMMASAIMGANGLSREREAGTWEGVRLSLLEPNQILRGKIIAPVLACLLFSLPVWPLLLPCIDWFKTEGFGIVVPEQALGSFLVWISTSWIYTLIGLLVGIKKDRSARAVGQTMGLMGAFLIFSPVVAYQFSSKSAELFLSVTHPLVAMSMLSEFSAYQSPVYIGIRYCLVQLVVGTVIWVALHQSLQNELKRGQS